MICFCNDLLFLWTIVDFWAVFSRNESCDEAMISYTDAINWPYEMTWGEKWSVVFRWTNMQKHEFHTSGGVFFSFCFFLHISIYLFFLHIWLVLIYADGCVFIFNTDQPPFFTSLFLPRHHQLYIIFPGFVFSVFVYVQRPGLFACLSVQLSFNFHVAHKLNLH